MGRWWPITFVWIYRGLHLIKIWPQIVKAVFEKIYIVCFFLCQLPNSFEFPVKIKLMYVVFEVLKIKQFQRRVKLPMESKQILNNSLLKPNLHVTTCKWMNIMVNIFHLSCNSWISDWYDCIISLSTSWVWINNTTV